MKIKTIHTSIALGIIMLSYTAGVSAQVDSSCTISTTTIVSNTSHIIRETGEPAKRVLSINYPNSRVSIPHTSIANWIWNVGISIPEEDTAATFDYTFPIAGYVHTARMYIAADDTYTFSINNNDPFEDNSPMSNAIDTQDTIDIPREQFIQGDNTISITVTNKGIPGTTYQTNQAGLLYALDIGVSNCPFVENPPTENPTDDGTNSTSTPATPPTSQDEVTKPTKHVSTSITHKKIGSRARSTSSRGQVLGAFSGPMNIVMPIIATSSCSAYLDGSPIGIGYENKPDQVNKLKAFLNEYVGSSAPLNGKLDAETVAAIRTFQEMFKSEIITPWFKAGLLKEDTPTGFVNKTTIRAINNLVCPTLALPLPTLQ